MVWKRLRPAIVAAVLLLGCAGGTGRAALSVGALEQDAAAAAAAGDLARAAGDWLQLVQVYARPATADQANNEALFWERLRAYYLVTKQNGRAAAAFAQELKYWVLAGRVDTEVWTLEQDAARQAGAGHAAAAAADWERLVAIYAKPANVHEANAEGLWWRDLRHYWLSTGQTTRAQRAFANELHYFALAGQEDTVVWKLEQQAAQNVAAHDMAAAAADWRQLIPIYAHPANVNQANNEALFWRRLGRYLLTAGDAAGAAHAFTEEAQYWKLADRAAWGNADQQVARAVQPVLDVYVAQPAPAASRPHLGRFDPGYGTYIGYFAEQDPGIGNAVGRIASVYGRKPAILLYYLNWGQPLPAGDVRAAQLEGAALEIALQPQQGLAPVLSDTSYLPALVAACAAARVPIFLRFAGEMNGAWTPWGANPQPGVPSFDAHAAQYVAAFRRVAAAMHSGAPNVAMVWSPNDMPQTGTEAYYPGNSYVDWVGVSAYLPHSLVGEPNVGVGRDWLSYLYWIVGHYGHDKPIMVAEGAVTHRDLITGADVTPWAVQQITAFFAGLPRLFPEVRAVVYWSSSDATSDYALSDDPAVARAMAAATASPWYLSALGRTSPVRYVKIGGVGGAALTPATGGGPSGAAPSAPALIGTQTLSAYVQDPHAVAAVVYRIDGRIVARAARAPYSAAVDFGALAPGPHRLSVVVETAGGGPVLAWSGSVVVAR